CRALFATHYHELTALADGNPHVANYSVSAREMGHDIVFLHRLVKGAASRSYGVAVARLAGLPPSVLARAQAMLKSFEGEGGVKPSKGIEREPSNQMPLFQQAPALSAKEREIIASLHAFDVENSTPLNALQLIEQLKKRL
ncbi:MAG TPA: DNA mismatch repair protein MutS, partial [Polyangiaceae bacterium]|nr:DNA mismatch repair protein MutS [Polyangiaceae bacterium]